MKLLYCRACRDFVALSAKLRDCHCGQVSGRYVTQSDVECHGPGVLVGFNSDGFMQALTAVDLGADQQDRRLNFARFIINPNVAAGEASQRGSAR